MASLKRHIAGRKRGAGIAALCASVVLLACVVGMHGLLPHADDDGMPSANDTPALVAEPEAMPLIDPNAPSAGNVERGASVSYEMARDNVQDESDPYVPGEVLLLLDAADTPEAVGETLASLDCVATKGITREDIDLGFAELRLVDGVDVLDAVGALEAAGRQAQPDFHYCLAEDDIEWVTDSEDLVPLSSALLPATTSIDDKEKGKLWGLSSMQAYEAWDIERAEGKAVVAVLDSGCLLRHEDLAANIVDSYVAVDVADYEDSDYTYDVDESSIASIDDILGHGTHVAGIVAGTANNGKGIAGVSYNAGILPIKVFYTYTKTNKNTGVSKVETSADSSDLVRAYAYISSYNDEHPEAPVRVVNMSVGGTRDSVTASSDKALIRAIDDATAKGILSVGAAGNYGADGPDVNYPSDYGSCLGVINLSRNGSTGVVTRYTSSNYNTETQTKGNTNKNISAPGTSIYSTLYNSSSSYGYKSGTSMACPYVAGVAALLYAHSSGLTVSQVKNILYASATDLVYSNETDNATVGWDRYTGYGEVNAYHALQLLDIAEGNATLGDHAIVKGGYVDLSVPYGGDGTWTWQSSNPSIAGVTADGRVTGFNVGSVTITATLANEFGIAATVTGTVEVRALTLAGATVDAIPAQTFTGQMLTPSIVVRKGGVPLTPGTDYDVTYSNNVNAGTGTVVAWGRGQYAGSVSATFVIAPKDLSGSFVYASNCVYTGVALEPTPTVTLDDVPLNGNTDYTVAYDSNVNVGNAFVTVTGKGNYTGTATGTFSIARASLSSASVVASAQGYVGSALTPVPNVQWEGRALQPNDDFAVISYADNVRPGLARMTIEGRGNFEGQASGYFVVFGPMDSGYVQIVGLWPVEYTGRAVEPDPIVGFAGVGLTRGVDYQLSYANNVNAGMATITIAGLGPYYANTKQVSFSIGPATLNVRAGDVTLSYGQAAPSSYDYEVSGLAGDDTCQVTVTPCYADGATAVVGDVSELPAGTYQLVPSVNLGAKASNYNVNRTNGTLTIQAVSLDDAQVTLPAQTYTFTGSAISPEPEVRVGDVLLAKDVDYTVAYEGNDLPGSATVTVTGTGNYEGTATATFDIEGGNVADATVQVDDATYTGSAITPSPVVVYYGKTLVEGTDYTLTYANNTKVGTASVTVRGKGNFKGRHTATFAIAQADISTASVAAEGATYTGSAIKPDPVVIWNGATLTKGTDYTVSYSNNTKVGTATVQVKGKGNFTGTAKGTFTISQKPSQGMYRLYNPNSGEHFYTANSTERDNLRKVGWRYEGIGWNAPTSGNAVYRLYNPNAGDHHYTTSATERDNLKRVGWRYEGVGWYSDTAKTVPLYRQYNPNAVSGSHNYTTSKSENDSLVRAGWRAEGIGWYGV